jgi:hypothetical protein
VAFQALTSPVIIWRMVGRERETNMTKPVSSFTEVHADYTTATAVCYTHSISKHNKQNIFNMNLAMDGLKHKVSVKGLSVTDFVGRKVICALAVK